MFEKYFENIEKKLNVRQTLIELRQEIKKAGNLQAAEDFAQDRVDVLVKLLSDQDAKVRKNAALILGEIGSQQSIEQLFEAYRNEAQLFVRSSYLTAISKLDYRVYMDNFRERVQELTNMQATPENQKHLSEELKLLREMILTMEGSKKHHFNGYEERSEMILLTSPGFEQLTYDQLPTGIQDEAKILNGGVLVRTYRLKEIMEIRTIKGILFRFCKNPLPVKEYDAVAEYLVNAGLQAFVEKRHSGKAPYYFRIDMKTKLVLDEKGRYVKRLAEKIEQLSDHQLQNSASNYEFEIRILENKKGQYSVYLKLDTIPDHRFDYRRNALATSMNPVKAAEIAALASEYLAEDATVLDPFCGTGTLLIERNKKKRARSMYGTDIFGDAVRLGRENASLAGFTINFINRDFADFKHEYKFDELITEMPSLSGKMQESDLRGIYQIFVRRLDEWMKPGSCVIVNTTQEQWLKSMALSSGYLHVEAVYHLSGKRQNALMILRYRSKTE